ncbi:MAG: glycosyltransferase family 2 protein [Planctomycetota bacterium]
MKIVMTLLVRDEEDILDHNLRYHLAQGVDFFIVMDHMSTDGTPEILDAYRRAGVAEVIPQKHAGYLQGQWVTSMARRAAVHHGADWVINNDADEFWWPLHGDLRSTLARVPDRFGGVAVARHNFQPLADSTGSFLDRMVHRDAVSTNNLGEPLPGKVCHRGHPEVIVSQGNHGAIVPGRQSLFQEPVIEILHFPMRSLKQFENKIALGGRAYEMSPELGAGTGSTWRSLFTTLKREGLERHYESACLAPDGIARMIQEGALVRDERLRNFMRADRSSAGPRPAGHPQTR